TARVPHVLRHRVEPAHAPSPMSFSHDSDTARGAEVAWQLGSLGRGFLLILPHVGARQPPSRHALCVRPAGVARAAVDPPAAGAAWAPAHAEPFAPRRATR